MKLSAKRIKYTKNVYVPVRMPAAMAESIDKAIIKFPEMWLDRSDFIRGATYRRLRELGIVGKVQFVKK